MSLNPKTRYITAEILLNKMEKKDAVSVSTELGMGLSTWYRNLGIEAVRAHRSPPPAHKEPRVCRGVGKPASRGAGFMAQRRQV